MVDLLDAVPMEDRDTKGDLYEYMLGKMPPPGKWPVPDPSLARLLDHVRAWNPPRGRMAPRRHDGHAP